MVSNIYLEKTLKHLKGFLGVFAANEIHAVQFNDEIFPQFSIVNTKTSSDDEMGHWLLISRYFNYDEMILEVYDSFGYPISLLHENIKNLIINLNYDFLITNNRIVQHLKSQYCGIFCIGRILSIINNESLLEHLNIFSDDLFVNNEILCDYIKKQ